ncbi:MAG: hypothetical protein IIB08_02410, partial [Bacteroidetes bacterium]|nr:hypothetical protein [Bacteroidota bacterium]
MANCNELFLKFHGIIVLSKSKKETLIISRNAVRNRINKYFKDNLEFKPPDFFQQGSFSLKTAINPLDGEYDIDDGVYLRNLDENERSKKLSLLNKLDDREARSFGMIISISFGETNGKLYK